MDETCIWQERVNKVLSRGQKQVIPESKGEVELPESEEDEGNDEFV